MQDTGTADWHNFLNNLERGGMNLESRERGVMSCNSILGTRVKKQKGVMLS